MWVSYLQGLAIWFHASFKIIVINMQVRLSEIADICDCRQFLNDVIDDKLMEERYVWSSDMFGLLRNCL